MAHGAVRGAVRCTERVCGVFCDPDRPSLLQVLRVLFSPPPSKVQTPPVPGPRCPDCPPPRGVPIAPSMAQPTCRPKPMATLKPGIRPLRSSRRQYLRYDVQHGSTFRGQESSSLYIAPCSLPPLPAFFGTNTRSPCQPCTHFQHQDPLTYPIPYLWQHITTHSPCQPCAPFQRNVRQDEGGQGVVGNELDHLGGESGKEGGWEVRINTGRVAGAAQPFEKAALRPSSPPEAVWKLHASTPLPHAVHLG